MNACHHKTLLPTTAVALAMDDGATRLLLPLGAYETWRMRTSFLKANAVSKMMASFLELLKAVK